MSFSYSRKRVGSELYAELRTTKTDLRWMQESVDNLGMVSDLMELPWLEELRELMTKLNSSPKGKFTIEGGILEPQKTKEK